MLSNIGISISQTGIEMELTLHGQLKQELALKQKLAILMLTHQIQIRSLFLYLLYLIDTMTL